MREEVFALTYCMEGMTYGDVERMLSVDREWYIKRLHQQLKKESEQMKRSMKTGKRRH